MIIMVMDTNHVQLMSISRVLVREVLSRHLTFKHVTCSKDVSDICV